MCGKPLDGSGRYCKACRRAYAKGHRARHSDLTPEQRLKANARAYANEYERRGKLVPQPCKIVGCKEKPEKHHPDYSKPLFIEWICRAHHLEAHKENP